MQRAGIVGQFGIFRDTITYQAKQKPTPETHKSGVDKTSYYFNFST